MLKLMLWLAILILVLLMPDISSSAARSALGIWGLDVVPSLFPYMVLCRLIADRLRRKASPHFPSLPFWGFWAVHHPVRRRYLRMLSKEVSLGGGFMPYAP